MLIFVKSEIIFQIELSNMRAMFAFRYKNDLKLPEALWVCKFSLKLLCTRFYV